MYEKLMGKRKNRLTNRRPDEATSMPTPKFKLQCDKSSGIEITLILL